MARLSRLGGPPKLLHDFLAELEWCATRKYVERLRDAGAFLTLGGVDVDATQLVDRHFLCDARRCLETAGPRVLVDRSCCSRYQVPVTQRDQRVVREHLDEARSLLSPGARLIDPTADPFVDDEDYGRQLVHDNELGGCEFNVYGEGRCRCALHGAALEAGANPHDYKPLACSLWPLAFSEYAVGRGRPRLLLTAYGEATSEIFDDTDDEPFACLVDQDPSYPRLYQAERPTLEYLLGAPWWRQLDRVARRRTRERES